MKSVEAEASKIAFARLFEDEDLLRLLPKQLKKADQSWILRAHRNIEES